MKYLCLAITVRMRNDTLIALHGIDSSLSSRTRSISAGTVISQDDSHSRYPWRTETVG